MPLTVYGLWHKDGRMFSAYALSTTSGGVDHLTGLLLIDRPAQVDPAQLGVWEVMYGKFSLFPMARDGALGVACNMFIDEQSRQYVRPFAAQASQAFYEVLKEFLVIPPNIDFEMCWDPDREQWASKPRIYPQGGIYGKPRFTLGEIVATIGATSVIIDTVDDPRVYLRRHITGDWGELCDDDKAENEYSVRHGFRILSRYSFSNGQPFYIITEADRSVTTILLPEEY
jgi:hypothetical protein